MVAIRLDPRLAGRFDPSDVLQDTYLDAHDKLPEYLRDPRVPFFLWLRFLTGHHVGRLHSDHLGRQIRDAGREVSLFQAATHSRLGVTPYELLTLHPAYEDTSTLR